MVRAAVIGCGRMGAQRREAYEFPNGWLPITHAHVLQSIEGVELVALSDVNKSALNHAGETYGVTALYRDYREMLEAEKIDLVSIATRTPEKADIIRACGDRMVYVEKPIANSIALARQCLSKPVAYGVNRRYHAVYRKAKELVAAGAIGDVVEIVFEFGHSPLLWCHPHTVDLAVFFLGADVLSIDAKLSGDPTECDPKVDYARFEWRNASAVITRGGGCNTRIYGSRATMTIHADGTRIQIDRGDAYRDNYEIREFQHSESASVTAIKELIAGNPTPSDEIVAGMQMLMGCVHSNILGQPVQPHQVPEDLTVFGYHNGKPA